MTFVIIENCKKCRYTDCVLVCPVDCFYSLAEQLVIDPEECIDCGACVPECPVEAIYAEDEVPPGHESAQAYNASKAMDLKGSGVEPITEQEEPLPTAAKRKAELGF